MSEDKPATNTDEPTTAESIDGFVMKLVEQGESVEAIRIQTWHDMTAARQQTVATRGTERKHLRTVIRAHGKPQGCND